MKRIYDKLSVILIMLLSLVIVFSTASLLITRVSADTAGSTQEQVQGENEAWYEITVGKDNKSLTILVDGTLGSYADLSQKDLADVKNKLLSAVKSIVINRLLEATDTTKTVAADYAMPLANGDGNEGLPTLPDLPDLSGSTLQQYKDYIYKRLKQEGELDKYLNGDYDVMIKYAVDQYLTAEKDKIEDMNDFTDKVTQHVQGIVDQVIEEKYEELEKQIEADETLSPQQKEEQKQALATEKSQAQKKNETKTSEIVTEVVENGGATITPADLLNATNSIIVSGESLYKGGKFSLAAIKQLILDLPKPAEIARFSDDEMELSYDIALDTTFGYVDFSLTFGLKSGYENVRRAAKFIADHIDVANDNGTYKIDVKVPDEFSAVLLKAANTSVIPDNIKHALFGMLDKPANEIVDKVGDYTYEQVMEYVKGIQFHKLFANVLNAEYLRSFLAKYNVNIQSLTNDNIDKFLNGVLNYAEKLANKQTVEGLEEFLHSYGIPGIPAGAENVVQKFLDLLNKIDYERYDATEIRNFLTSEDRINNFLGRIEGSYRVESLYNSFIDYAETLFTKLPARLQNGKIINLYDKTNTLSWVGNVNIDVKQIVRDLVETANKNSSHSELEAAVESALGKIEGNLNYNWDIDLTMSIPDIYKVTYAAGDEVLGEGLLPVGANVNFFANTEEVTVNNEKFAIEAWKDSEEKIYRAGVENKFEMPAKDLALQAITGFNAALSVNGTSVSGSDYQFNKNYDGTAVKLTANVSGGIGYDVPEYKWYKIPAPDSEVSDYIELEEGQECGITDVADSGEYVCIISETLYLDDTNDYIVLEAETAHITVTIRPKEVDISGAKWQVMNSLTGETTDYDPANTEYKYTGSAYKVTLTGYTLPTGITVEYRGTYQASAEGTYQVFAIFTGSENYTISGLQLGQDEAHAITWSIKKEDTPTPPNPPEANTFTKTFMGTEIKITDVNGVVPKDAQIVPADHSSNYTLDSFAGLIELADGKEAVIINVIDIKFNINVAVGEYRVELTNPAFAGKTMVIIHIHGSDPAEKIEVTQSGSTVSFTVDGFSDFASVGIQDKVVTAEEDNDSNWWIWLLVAIIIILLIVIIILIVYLLRKQNDFDDDARPNVIIIKTDEIVEETEAQVEETKPDETPAQEETAAAAAEEPDEDEIPMPLVADDGRRIVYDKSFAARLSQSESAIKDYYTELKNDILSYKGVKSRVSWHFDSFNKGRTKCLKLQLRGKSMYMYIALPAAELPEKYHVKDMSDKARYKEVPTMLKIRRPRSLKYAKQLVAILMERLGVERGETPNEKYRPRYRSTKSLIDMGLVKVKYTHSTFAAPKSKDDENK